MFSNMRFIVTFVTAVCVLFLNKLGNPLWYIHRSILHTRHSESDNKSMLLWPLLGYHSDHTDLCHRVKLSGLVVYLSIALSKSLVIGSI